MTSIMLGLGWAQMRTEMEAIIKVELVNQVGGSYF